MEHIFNVIDIWLNIIPHVDYRTFHIIKRLNKTIYRDCYIKRKPLIEDFKNWNFNLKYIVKEIDEPIKDDSEWKSVKRKTIKNNNYQTDMMYIEKIKELEYKGLVNFLASHLPHGDKNYKLRDCLLMLIPGDIIDIWNDKINEKYPLKFYFDGNKFIKMNYRNMYAYPEHILQIVGDDLYNFLLTNKCLIHVTNIVDMRYKNQLWYGPQNGQYGEGYIGFECRYYGYKGMRTCYDILINDKITLKSSNHSIYVFLKN